MGNAQRLFDADAKVGDVGNELCDTVLAGSRAMNFDAFFDILDMDCQHDTGGRFYVFAVYQVVNTDVPGNVRYLFRAGRIAGQLAPAGLRQQDYMPRFRQFTANHRGNALPKPRILVLIDQPVGCIYGNHRRSLDCGPTNGRLLDDVIPHPPQDTGRHCHGNQQHGRTWPPSLTTRIARVRRALEPFAGNIHGPCQQHSRRKTDYQQDNQAAHSPGGCPEFRKDYGRDLHDDPGNDDVRTNRSENTASRQFRYQTVFFVGVVHSTFFRYSTVGIVHRKMQRFSDVTNFQ